MAAESQRWDIALRDEIPKHPEHRGSVAPIVEKGYLETLAHREEIAKVVHYDPDGRVLSVEDPHLIFFLRNLDRRVFAREVGFTHIDIEHPYDFALSFAGEDRAFASRLHNHLEDLGFVVFYDFNEQHRIIARDLEAFLGPIYESGATLVVAILGPQYGERRWTRFESEQFMQRFDGGRVIPVWSSKATTPTPFDRAANIGALRYDPDVRRPARWTAWDEIRNWDNRQPVTREKRIQAVGRPA